MYALTIVIFPHRNMDLSSVESSSPSPSEQGEESPKNKSTSFSISAILSEDVGRRRTQTANTVGGIGKHMRMEGSGGGGSPTSTISLSQAASMMMTSPVGGSTVMRPGTYMYMEVTHSLVLVFFFSVYVDNDAHKAKKQGRLDFKDHVDGVVQM